MRSPRTGFGGPFGSLTDCHPSFFHFARSVRVTPGQEAWHKAWVRGLRKRYHLHSRWKGEAEGGIGSSLPGGVQGARLRGSSFPGRAGPCLEKSGLPGKDPERKRWRGRKMSPTVPSIPVEGGLSVQISVLQPGLFLLKPGSFLSRSSLSPGDPGKESQGHNCHDCHQHLILHFLLTCPGS